MARPIIVGALVNFGAEGAAYGSRTAVTVGSNTDVVIPAGFWLCETDSHETVRVTYDSGSNYITLVGTSAVGAIIYSDGYSTSFRGDATGGTGRRSQILTLG
jgi:hypothetical protein